MKIPHTLIILQAISYLGSVRGLTLPRDDTAVEGASAPPDLPSNHETLSMTDLNSRSIARRAVNNQPIQATPLSLQILRGIACNTIKVASLLMQAKASLEDAIKNADPHSSPPPDAVIMLQGKPGSKSDYALRFETYDPWNPFALVDFQDMLNVVNLILNDIGSKISPTDAMKTTDYIKAYWGDIIPIPGWSIGRFTMGRVL